MLLSSVSFKQVATMFNSSVPVCTFAQTTTGIVLVAIHSRNENTHKTNEGDDDWSIQSKRGKLFSELKLVTDNLFIYSTEVGLSQLKSHGLNRSGTLWDNKPHKPVLH